jgi:hypothetical protein
MLFSKGIRIWIALSTIVGALFAYYNLKEKEFEF